MQRIPERPTTAAILERVAKVEDLVSNHVLSVQERILERLGAIERQQAELRGVLRFIRWAVPSAVAIAGIIVYRLL